MRLKINQLLMDNSDLNQVSSWVNQTTQYLGNSHNRKVLRIFCLALAYTRICLVLRIHRRNKQDLVINNIGDWFMDFEENSRIPNPFNIIQDYPAKEEHDFKVDLELGIDFHYFNSELIRSLAQNLFCKDDGTFIGEIDLAHALGLKSEHIQEYQQDDLPPLYFTCARHWVTNANLIQNIFHILHLQPTLGIKISNLRSKLPEDWMSYKELRKWPLAEDWLEQLNAVASEFYNASDTWKYTRKNFTHEQQKNYLEYCYVNQLLLNCLNSDCYVNKTTRQEIENTLFLPISEIEAREAQ